MTSNLNLTAWLKELQSKIEYLDRYRQMSLTDAGRVDMDERLGRIVDELAHASGEVEVYRSVFNQVGYLVQMDTDVDTVAIKVLSNLLNLTLSTDDTWSGRGNDRKRMIHDGRCSAARGIMNVLDYGFQ